jgi:hypothetical protein
MSKEIKKIIVIVDEKKTLTTEVEKENDKWELVIETISEEIVEPKEVTRYIETETVTTEREIDINSFDREILEIDQRIVTLQETKANLQAKKQELLAL